MHDSQYDILCVGDAVIDAFLALHNASVHCRLDRTKCELCVQYGAKIPLDDCQFQTGGNGANVSVGLSRMGKSTALMAEIGDDEFTQKIHKALEKEQVDKSRVLQTQDASSTFSMIINFQGERTIFTKHITRQHNFSFENIQTQWLYLTSLGNEWKQVYKKAGEFIKTNKALLAFNPGSLQLDEGIQEIREVLPVTDILFVNKEEAVRISNFQFPISNEKENEEIIPELLRKIHEMGVKTVVITDGVRGSYTIDAEGKIVFCNTYESPRIEFTGAGDAYASGVLGAILSGKTLSDGMKWGTVNATSVIGKVGAQPGLLTKKEIEKKLSENPELKVEKLV